VKTCPECRTELASNASTCPKCGRRFTTGAGVAFAILLGLLIGGCVLGIR
jgi:RNA polymerase subunit RPABC4/transcription elongation factor Spt4